MGSEEAGSITLGQYLRQLARHQNFLWFVGMDLVQVWGNLPHPSFKGSSRAGDVGSQET